MSFTSTPRGTRLARLSVAHCLDTWGHPYDSEVNETLTLITAELGANAMWHGRVPGRDFHVRLTARGPVQLFTVTDRSGLPLVCAADGRATPRPGRASPSSTTHRASTSRRKRTSAAGGPGCTGPTCSSSWTSAAETPSSSPRPSSTGSPVEALAVTGGGGVLDSVRATLAPVVAADAAPGPAETVTPSSQAPAAARTPAAGARDAAWDRVVDFLDPDEPGLLALAEPLAARGVPVPEDGYELDENGWLAELAWPGARIGVVLAPRAPEGEDEDPEAVDRDRAFTAAGWDVRPAAEWTADDLADCLAGAPRSGDRARTDRPDSTTTTENGESEEP